MYLICHKGPTLYVCFPRLPGRWKSANRSRNEIPGEMARWWEIRDPTKRVLIYGGTWQRWWLMSVFSRIICAWDFSKSHAKHEAVGCGPLHGVPAASSTIKTLSCVMSYFYPSPEIADSRWDLVHPLVWHRRVEGIFGVLETGHMGKMVADSEVDVSYP